LLISWNYCCGPAFASGDNCLFAGRDFAQVLHAIDTKCEPKAPSALHSSRANLLDAEKRLGCCNGLARYQPSIAQACLRLRSGEFAQARDVRGRPGKWRKETQKMRHRHRIEIMFAINETAKALLLESFKCRDLAVGMVAPKSLLLL
jgi:hypothetical protein